MTVAQLLAMVDDFDWDTYNDDLKGDFADILGNIVDIQGARGAALAGNPDVWDAGDPFVQKFMTKYVGERIVQLSDTTKSDVSDLIRSVMADDGAGTANELGDRIMDRVRETFDGYADYRADRIARSETSIAYNFGNIFGFRQAGVETVTVSDGDEDEECAKADGEEWTLEEALADPIAHPNCERDFSPNQPDESEEE
jgi:hypothetical protein